MDFRNWILETFTPVVMVVASAEAEALIAEHNGLTIVDMLRPYGYFHHLSGTKLQLQRTDLTELYSKLRSYHTVLRSGLADMQSLCALLESSPIALRSSSLDFSVAKTCMLQEMRSAASLPYMCDIHAPFS